MKALKGFDTRNVSAYLRGLNLHSLRLRLADIIYQKPSTIQLLHRIDIYDKTGKLVKTTGDRKSHSFVLQFLQILELHMAHIYSSNPDGVTVKDTDGNNRTWSYTSSQYVANTLAVEAPSTDDSYGILVGTGTTAPTLDNYALETKITHGSGSGQLQYGATSVAAAAIVGSNVDMVISRTFINASGASITIREVGLALREMWYGSTNYKFLIAHDAVNQMVENTYIAVVTYTVRVTV
jgi:hypothetical protein